MPRRTDSEDVRVHFQSERFVFQNGEWFYMTRDGAERGPFDDKADAAGDLILYLRGLLNNID